MATKLVVDAMLSKMNAKQRGMVVLKDCKEKAESCGYPIKMVNMEMMKFAACYPYLVHVPVLRRAVSSGTKDVPRDVFKALYLSHENLQLRKAVSNGTLHLLQSRLKTIQTGRIPIETLTVETVRVGDPIAAICKLKLYYWLSADSGLQQGIGGTRGKPADDCRTILSS